MRAAIGARLGARPAAALCALVGIALCVAIGCGSDSPSAPAPPADSIRKGVSLSPRSLLPSDLIEFAQRADEAGEIVTWAGDWMELADTTTAPHALAKLAPAFHYTPVVLATPFRTEDGAPLRQFTAPTRAAYKRAAAEFVRRYRPEFIGFGIETDVLLGRPAADLDAFVAFFAEVYDTVKAVSPGTLVLTTFQLERMKGLRGGLFGGVNDTTRAEWALLDRFPKLDLVAFSTYPSLIFSAPDSMPADYYTSAASIVAARTGKPIAFTESGWHSAAAPAGWESSESEQAAFVARLFDLVGGASPHFLVWSFVYDQATPVPFNSMGLRRRDGTARPAWNAWVGAQ